MEAYDDSLVAAFETALKNSFSSLRTTYNEQFYYYAFIFDSGLYPYISAWSYEALEKSIIENNIDDQESAWWKWDCCDSPYVAYGYVVTVGRAGEKEIDFVCEKRGEKLYVQVTYLLASEDTVKREFGAYDGIQDNFPKYVVSLDEFDMSRNGIKHRNIRDFLLAEEWN